ncbi:hypothetical protein Pla123a_28330 [Posidoniimonas polymericola]|uniref:HD domain-containing protein n=1 Tax=Posidoniimonas polymericola TaxID=2528002 RepID=A0A5C5YML3_9BACT|nr:phosphonate degradation HD-domain oxygenase [Posidoniimonas polymericola]TWT76047.1 hypothetical protein Pla123a_28330 [Posidoniimonas polymericola]
MPKEENVREVLSLFAEHGESQYGGEAVSQLEHGIQAATWAEREGASAELITAALLHDVGHLLHNLPDDAPDNGVDDLHEVLGAEWLGNRFPESVLEPVRMHVDAKRYLCAADPNYRAGLSEPSEISLQLQGGPMNRVECEAFRSNPHFEDAVRLRRWDDLAKDPDMQTPNLDHFMQYVQQACVRQASTPTN